MKVTAFIGSGRKKHTYRAAEMFLQKLQALGDVDYEIVRLNEYSIGTCKGCCKCLNTRAEFCPMKDDYGFVSFPICIIPAKSSPGYGGRGFRYLAEKQ